MHLCVKQIKPPVGHRSHGSVALLQGVPSQELLKDLRAKTGQISRRPAALQLPTDHTMR
jgi:hypothetical protein